MNGYFKTSYQNFCKNTELEFYDNCILKKVSNISEFIRNDNSTYYYDRKDLIDNAYGMLYEDSSKQWIILIDENQNPADFFATLIHEYVHLCDYKKLTGNTAIIYLFGNYKTIMFFVLDRISSNLFVK